jgi:hypothetical protein
MGEVEEGETGHFTYGRWASILVAIVQSGPSRGDTPPEEGSVQVNGWFDGLRPEELEAGVRACIEEGRGFVVEAWGLRDAGPDRDLSERLELGDRAVHDARRENGEDALEREDWIVVKAMAAAPGRPFLDLLEAPAG